MILNDEILKTIVSNLLLLDKLTLVFLQSNAVEGGNEHTREMLAEIKLALAIITDVLHKESHDMLCPDCNKPQDGEHVH